jgi:Bacterial CdiA-CT RNAse A domain
MRRARFPLPALQIFETRMTYFHPAGLAHQDRRFTRADAWRLAPPGTPEAKPPGWLDPWMTRVRAKEAAEEEARAREAVEQEERERELAELRDANARVRIMLADVKFELALRALGQKYSQSQPRVPAGSPEGGQWTSGANSVGNAAADSSLANATEQMVLSDATPDPIVAGAQYAQDTTRRYSVDLDEEEARGGHTLDKHVNKSPEALVAQAREAFDRNPRAQDSRSGSFLSNEDATRLVNSTLAQNRASVDQVASGIRFRELVQSHFESVMGIEAVMPSINTPPYIRNTYGVGVVIQNDPLSPRGYRIVTGFPTNR